MKNLKKIIFATTFCLIATSCAGGEASTVSSVEVTPVPSPESTPLPTEEAIKVLDFDGTGYQDSGEGTFGLAYTSGRTLEGGEIIIYVDDPNKTMQSLGIEAWDFNGSLLTFVYVDGMLNTKEQLGSTQTSIMITEDALSTGEHKVEAVQYADNDSTKEVLTYKSAIYTVKEK